MFLIENDKWSPGSEPWRWPTPSPHPPLMINRVRYRGEVSDIVTSSYPPDSWHPSSRVNSLLSPPSPASPVWIMSAEIWLRYVHISSRLIRRQWATWPGRSPGPPSWGVGSVDWFYLLERIGSIFGAYCFALHQRNTSWRWSLSRGTRDQTITQE